MEDNKKGKWLVDFYQNHKIIFNVICILLIIVVLGIVVPFVINITAIGSDFPSKAGNDGWISFWGSYIGGIFGGAGTLIALYISSNQAREHQRESMQLTRKIQEENREDMQKQIDLEKNSKQVEYLKYLYIHSYKYEKYIKTKLEEILNEIYWLNDEFKNNETHNSEIGLEIREKSMDVIDTLEDLSRDIKIQSASVQSKEIKKIVDFIISFDEDMMEKVIEVTNDDYHQERIGEMFSDEDGLFAIIIQLLIALNVEVYNEIERISCKK
ncbi:hypothetical protein [Clostridium perfringens]|uniref:hypothetical protein n=1 Tax=Clostridium perfringens TaxID=1502 RepID=UPI0022459817|nr:hypothetical protein [Clostridium perfringens]MCX0377035.1 hypothetical protein [Clostridium perfringens]